MYADCVVEGPNHALEAEHDCRRSGTDVGYIVLWMIVSHRGFAQDTFEIFGN
jgi:hypothetical protein